MTTVENYVSVFDLGQSQDDGGVSYNTYATHSEEATPTPRKQVMSSWLGNEDSAIICHMIEYHLVESFYIAIYKIILKAGLIGLKFSEKNWKFIILQGSSLKY